MRMLTMPTFRGKQTDLTNLLAQEEARRLLAEDWFAM